MTEEKKDLIVAEELKAVTVFTAKGIRPFIDKIKEAVQGIVPDVSTAKGREEVVKLAYRVTQSKTLIDKTGKKFVDEYKEKCKPVDAARKIARDELTELATEVRKPVTEWEEAEAKRIEEERKAEEQREALALIKITNIRNKVVDLVGKPSGLIRHAISGLEKQEISAEVFGKNAEEAVLAKDHTVKKLREMLEAAITQEEQAARLAELEEKAAKEESAAEVPPKIEKKEAPATHETTAKPTFTARPGGQIPPPQMEPVKAKPEGIENYLSVVTFSADLKDLFVEEDGGRFHFPCGQCAHKERAEGCKDCRYYHR